MMEERLPVPREARPLGAGAVLFIVLIVLSRCADIASTYLVTPDLTNELNPFVAVWGFGWFGLIMIAVVAVLILSVMAFYHFRYNHSFYPAVPMERSEFNRQYISGGDYSFVRIMFDPIILKHRKVRQHAWNWFLFILPLTLIVIGFYAATHNTLIYLGGYGLMAPAYLLFITILTITVMSIGTMLWLSHNYNQYLASVYTMRPPGPGYRY